MPSNNNPQYAVDLERTANTPVAEGVHVFKITEVDEGQKTGPNGNPEPGSYPYWRITCAPQTPTEEGKTVDMIMSLSPKARWRMEIFLDAVGAPAEGSATADKFVGRQFRGKVTHEDYNGRPQARIGEMFKVSSGKAVKPAPVVIEKATKKSKKGKAADKPADKPAEDPIADVADDIEFEETEE